MVGEAGASALRFSARVLNPFDKLLGRVGDQLEVTGLRSGGEAAAHANGNRARLDPVADVFEADTAGRHQGRLGQRALHRFYESGAQSLAGK